MTRRRTSVIGAARAPQAAPVDVQLPALRQWAAMAVRELVLSADGDPQQELARLADTRRRWRIAHGREKGNPETDSGRSMLERLAPDNKGTVYWRKQFTDTNRVWMANETDVLKRCMDVDPQGTTLACHVSRMTLAGQTRLVEVTTRDAGPNLGMWQDFAPCSGVGAAALPLPLFAQPVVLGAVVRQLLIALRALAEHQVVHTDLKPGNLCLAMPKGDGAWVVGKGTVQGRWNLRDLPLQLIDFEIGFASGIARQPHPGDNPNQSPYLRACHRVALALPDDHDRAEVMSGIDWGTDAWATGFMLAEWCEQAKAFIAAYRDAFDQRWGFASPAWHTADQALSPIQVDLVWLATFATTLQAQERPLADAGKRRLPARDYKDLLRNLWGQLEDKFPPLNPSAQAAASTVTFSLIDPEAPLAEEARPSRWRLAAQAGHRRSAALAAAAVASASRTAAKLSRRRAPLATGALLAAAAALGISNAQALRHTGTGSTAWLAQGLLAVSLNPAVPYALTSALATPPRHLLDSLDPGQGDVLALQTLVQAEPAYRALIDRNAGGALQPATLGQLARQREADLRSLRVLASLADAALAGAQAKGLSARLLVRVSEAGNLLEQAAGKPVPVADPAQAINALARLQATQGWPMAAWLLAHYHACYAPDAGAQHLPAALALLVAVPARAPGGDFYPAWGREWQGRQQGHRPLCHFSD